MSLVIFQAAQYAKDYLKKLEKSYFRAKMKSIWEAQTNRHGQIAQNRGADSMGLVPGPKIQQIWFIFAQKYENLLVRVTVG